MAYGDRTQGTQDPSTAGSLVTIDQAKFKAAAEEHLKKEAAERINSMTSWVSDFAKFLSNFGLGGSGILSALLTLDDWTKKLTTAIGIKPPEPVATVLTQPPAVDPAAQTNPSGNSTNPPVVVPPGLPQKPAPAAAVKR